MCGISTVINKKAGIVPEEVIQKMTNLVRHRGPDGEGYFHQGSLAMGHRRLKIIDLSNSAAQPMTGFGHIISYNGEIYNYPELRSQLIKAGFVFYTQSDTEVILASYAYWGQDCVSHFIGMWAFCLYDPDKNILFCSRDRYGIKPLCYTDGPEYFAIGSEIKQFLALPDFSARLNHESVFHFLYPAGCQASEESFFRDARILPPGANLIYDLESNEFDIQKWYSFRSGEINEEIGYDDACTLFREKFLESLSLHCRSDVEFGAFISGGLDSSSIGLSIQSTGALKLAPLRVISSCFEETAHNEIKYIDAVLAKGNFQGHKIYPDIRDLLKNNLFQKINFHQDQPISGGSFFSEYKIFEKAHELGLKVILDGQGPDEYLAGYHGFHEYYLKSLLLNLRLSKFNQELAAFSKFGDQKNIQLLVRMGKDYARLLARKTMHKVNRGYFAPVWLSRDWFLRHYPTDTLPVNAVESASPGDSLRSLTEAALYKFSLPPQLTSQDRHAMMHSVESRLPFLDHRLVEFTLSLPEQFKIRKGATKSVLRDAMKDILPDVVHKRHQKLGLPGPEDCLFAEHNKVIEDQLQELIDAFPGIFTQNLTAQYQLAIKHNGYYQGLVFKALSFLHWARAFNLHHT